MKTSTLNEESTSSASEDQVTLQALEQFVSEHPLKDEIHKAVAYLRGWRDEHPHLEVASIAICLVGAEMAAAS